MEQQNDVQCSLLFYFNFTAALWGQLVWDCVTGPGSLSKLHSFSPPFPNLTLQPLYHFTQHRCSKHNVGVSQDLSTQYILSHLLKNRLRNTWFSLSHCMLTATLWDRLCWNRITGPRSPSDLYGRVRIWISTGIVQHSIYDNILIPLRSNLSHLGMRTQESPLVWMVTSN